MIITPKMLKEWLDNNKNFKLIDTRPKGANYRVSHKKTKLCYCFS